MIATFSKLVSKNPIIRKIPGNQEQQDYQSTNPMLINPNNSHLFGLPIWVQFRKRNESGGEWIDDRWNPIVQSSYIQKELKYNMQHAPIGTNRLIKTLCKREGYFRYIDFHFSPWTALTANRRQLPFHVPPIHSRFSRSSPERKLGLTDSIEEASRIKSFRLKEALGISYVRDIRFVLAVCTMIGLGLWWYMVPEPLQLTPKAIIAPDIPLLTNVVKDTFINNVCSNHPWMTSPCPCGEPLNNTVRDLIPEPNFDPLDINKSEKVKAIAVFFAFILLSIALTESVSTHGVLLQLEQ